MYPVLMLGKIPVPMYGIMALIGFVLAITFLLFHCKNYGIRKDDAFHASCYAIIGILVGSKLLSILSLLPRVITHFSLLLKYPMDVLSYLFGGFVFYGGLIGGAFGVYLYTRIYKLSWIPYMNASAPSIPLFHAFGRIGCLLAGCCYGMEYSGPFAIIYPLSEYTNHDGITSRFPTPVIEILFNLCLFMVLALLSKRKPKPGRLLGIYIIAYSVMRFTLEFFRGDSARGTDLGFSTSQWISLILFPVGIYLVSGHFLKRLQKKTPRS